jgi:hypothetical protein
MSGNSQTAGRAAGAGSGSILGDMAIQRMDNVGMVVDDLDAAVAFFTELGMELEGRMPIEGSWAGNVVGHTTYEARSR